VSSWSQDGNGHFEVNGIYERCRTCRCGPRDTYTHITLKRAPNPAGSHLPTSEPIYITPHRAPCDRIEEKHVQVTVTDPNGETHETTGVLQRPVPQAGSTRVSFVPGEMTEGP